MAKRVGLGTRQKLFGLKQLATHMTHTISFFFGLRLGSKNRFESNFANSNVSQDEGPLGSPLIYVLLRRLRKLELDFFLYFVSSASNYYSFPVLRNNIQSQHSAKTS